MNLCPDLRKKLQEKMTLEEQAKIDEGAGIEALKNSMIEILSDKDIQKYCALYKRLELGIKVNDGQYLRPLCIGFICDGVSYGSDENHIKTNPEDFFGFFFIGTGGCNCPKKYTEKKEIKEIIFNEIPGINHALNWPLTLRDLRLYCSPGYNCRESVSRLIKPHVSNTIYDPENKITSSDHVPKYEPLTPEMLEDAVAKAIEHALYPDPESKKNNE
jgi:hypothetical protein